MRLILASSSPRRRELLAQLGVPFDVLKPDIDETRQPDEPPFDFVKRLSQEKARAVTMCLDAPATVLAADTIVLAADTVGVADGGDVLGKPETADDAWRMLRHLRGRSHLVCTAFTLLRFAGDDVQEWTDLVKTRVYMRNYADSEIAAYIATGDPFDKAGSYAIQHTGFSPVEWLEGDYNNVVGLPLDAVRQSLEQVRLSGVEPSNNNNREHHDEQKCDG